MDVAIVQTARADAEAYLRALEPLLPKSFAARVELRDLSLPISSRLPRLIAVVPDVEESDFALVEQAMGTVGTPGFMLSAGGLPAAPLDLTFPDPEIPPALPTDLAWQTDMADTVADDPEVIEVLERIMDAEPSKIPFPETLYEGEERAAYDAIVKKLRVAPMDDRGERLTVQDIRDIKPPRRPPGKARAWKAVLAHLESEVKYFGYARAWFGDGGHLRNMYRDQPYFDNDFLNTVNKRFKLVEKPDQKMVFFLNIAMSLLVEAGGKIPSFGKPLATIMGKIWAYTLGQQGDPNGMIKGKIDEIRDAVVASFTDSVIKVEQVHVALCGDWGNLAAFADLYETGKLRWNDDGSGLRTAHALGFHYETLRVLLAIKSRLDTGSSGYANTTWGIVSNSEKVKKAAKRSWDAKNFILHSKTYEDCGNIYRSNIFIGSQYCPLPPPSRPPPPCNKALPADTVLLKKLFGTDISDEKQPELGISSKLLDDKDWRKTNSWALAPYF